MRNEENNFPISTLIWRPDRFCFDAAYIFRLNAEESIQMVTALALQLIQCVVKLPEPPDPEKENQDEEEQEDAAKFRREKDKKKRRSKNVSSDFDYIVTERYDP